MPNKLALSTYHIFYNDRSALLSPDGSLTEQRVRTLVAPARTKSWKLSAKNKHFVSIVGAASQRPKLKTIAINDVCSDHFLTPKRI
jgi:hypothetical protein